MRCMRQLTTTPAASRTIFSDMEFRTLTPEDGPRLLAFEIENRDWFEQFIPPRPEEFYSAAGIAVHIANCLDDFRLGLFHPCVVVDREGRIVGRANLRDMDLAMREAKIGYRIDAHHAGRGLASAAVAQLKEQARSTWNLARLKAVVTPINPASMRVLEKSGFRRTGVIAEATVVAGKIYDCHEYAIDLA
jgi:[ribosomal protein S5]-alanine N-acetyltransferase